MRLVLGEPCGEEVVRSIASLRVVEESEGWETSFQFDQGPATALSLENSQHT